MLIFTEEGYRICPFEVVFKLDLPLYVMLGNTKFILNLNRYRNAHYRVLAAAKLKYSLEVLNLLPDNYPKFLEGEFFCHYTLFPKTAAIGDVSNPLSVIDKFTQDAIVEAGMFKDDNYKIIKGANYVFGEIDRTNPRAELRVCKLFSGEILH